NDAFRQRLQLDDYGLRIREIRRREPRDANQYLSIESDQLVLSVATVDAVEAAAKELGLQAEPTIIYIADSLKHGDKEIPYPVIAGLTLKAPRPLGPFLRKGLTSLADNEVILLEWDGNALKGLPDRTELTLTYFDPEVEGEGRLKAAKLILRAPDGYL